MKQCPKCHEDNPIDAKFCWKCGFCISEIISGTYTVSSNVSIR